MVINLYTSVNATRMFYYCVPVFYTYAHEHVRTQTQMN